MALAQSYHAVVIYDTAVAAAAYNTQLDAYAYEVDATPENIIIRNQAAPPVADPRNIIIRETTDPLEVTSGVYPAVGDVDSTATKYGPTGTEYTGTMTVPAPANVALGVTYGANGIEFTGTLTPGLASGTPLIDPTTGRQYVYVQIPIIVGVN